MNPPISNPMMGAIVIAQISHTKHEKMSKTKKYVRSLLSVRFAGVRGISMPRFAKVCYCLRLKSNLLVNSLPLSE